MTKTTIAPIDTETCAIVPADKVTPGNNLTYHIAYEVLEPATGKVFASRNYVVEEIFYGEAERMRSAYYANKLPQYYEAIEAGVMTVASFWCIMAELLKFAKEYKLRAVCAHNARFDVDALNTTAEWLSGQRMRVLPDSVEVWDSMRMWNAVKPKRYSKFCDENGYKTNHTPPRDRMTVEVITRYLSGDNNFIEAHTALEDVHVEEKIILAAYKSHKRMAKERVMYQAKA